MRRADLFESEMCLVTYSCESHFPRVIRRVRKREEGSGIHTKRTREREREKVEKVEREKEREKCNGRVRCVIPFSRRLGVCL